MHSSKSMKTLLRYLL